MATANRICTIEDCSDIARGKGYCWRHYNKWRRHGDPVWKFVQRTCSVETCATSARVGGMCDMHYRRTRNGDVNKGRPVHAPICSKESCDETHDRAGLCGKHYFIHWTTEGKGRELLAAARATRRARVANAPVVERGLSWRTLWAEGIRNCYLCGVACDLSDYRTAKNRGGWEQHISGPTYPSLDHIQALANGGEHSRSNVSIACSRCNSRKHSKVDYEAQFVAPKQDAGTHR